MYTPPINPTTGLPQQIMLGNRTSMALGSVLNSYTQGSPQAVAEADRVLGFGLPPFQRPAVWTVGQQAAFIESLYLGFPLGEVVITQQGIDGNPQVRLLIDGQQRLRAVEAWVFGDLEVGGVRYRDLSATQQNMFHFTTTISVLWLMHNTDEATLRFIYQRLNFGGTAHAPEHHPDVYQRPTP